MLGCEIESARDELIPIFDEQGIFRQPVQRADLYRNPDYHHRIVHNLIYLPLQDNMEPEQMWVQVRGEQSKYLPGYMVSAASGHVNLAPTGQPETDEQAMMRELKEEIFTDEPIPTKHTIQRLGSHFTFKPNYPGYTCGRKEVTTFISESNGTGFSPSNAEVARLLPIPVGDLKDMARNPFSLLHPEFREILNKKMIRIGIVGTYSAGKTTLTEALSKRIHGAMAITEDVRRYVRELFRKKGIQELTPEEFIALEHMLFKDQTVASRKTDIAIIDSTPIGCPVYLQHYGILARNGHKYEEKIIAGWLKKTQGALNEYDMIVYLPPEIPYESDGFRTGEEFRVPLDEGFRKMIQHHPRAITVTGYVQGDVSAGVKKRVQTILDCAKKMGIFDNTHII